MQNMICMTLTATQYSKGAHVDPVSLASGVRMVHDATMPIFFCGHNYMSIISRYENCAVGDIVDAKRLTEDGQAEPYDLEGERHGASTPVNAKPRSTVVDAIASVEGSARPSKADVVDGVRWGGGREVECRCFAVLRDMRITGSTCL